jgi:hypothetical protein
MIYRYQPAFFSQWQSALQQRFAPTVVSRLQAWAHKTEILVELALRAAEQSGLDAEARKQLKVHIDRRDVAFETILKTVRFHAVQEYTYLLNRQGDHFLTTLYATNINDQYWLSQLADLDVLTNADLKSALVNLRDHLGNVPSSK